MTGFEPTIYEFPIFITLARKNRHQCEMTVILWMTLTCILIDPLIFDSEGFDAFYFLKFTSIQSPSLCFWPKTIEMKPIWINPIMMSRFHHSGHSENIFWNFIFTCFQSVENPYLKKMNYMVLVRTAPNDFPKDKPVNGSPVHRIKVWTDFLYMKPCLILNIPQQRVNVALQSRWGWGALFDFPAFSSSSRFFLLRRFFSFELIDWKWMMIHTHPYDSKIMVLITWYFSSKFLFDETQDEKIILNREMWKKRLSNQWLNTDNESASNETPGDNENCPNSKFYLSK